MIKEKIEILIVKYATNQIDALELQQLTNWVSEGDNKLLFQEYIRINFSIEELKNTTYINKDQVWETLENQIKKSKAKNNYWKYAAAASILIVMSISIIFKDKGTSEVINPSINNDIAIGTDKAILTLENGENIALEKGTSLKLNDLESNGKAIIYKARTLRKSVKEIAYNYITIPRGGQYNVTLSDGTKVWLNSESKIKYPKSFVAGEDRKVELVYGEAYFDVSSSKNHNGSKFKVLNDNQTVEVLGTEFNVKAYKSDEFLYTTLVEGKVNVSNKTNKSILQPGEQSLISREEKVIKIRNVDVYNAISWRDGIFSFEGKSLKKIMKVISRWYDVNVFFEDKSLEGIEFNGIFRKKQNIEEILISIKNTGFINSYEIKNKKILLK